MNRTAKAVAITHDYGTIKATIGALAVAAAAASAACATMAPSLFGALTAIALSAGGIFAALVELANPGAYRDWRLVAWSALVPGWIIIAAILLNVPLAHLEGQRILISVLIAVGAALRAWRWQVLQYYGPQGVTIALGFALLPLAATWLFMRDTPAAAINVACAFELFGSGSLWLAEALVLPCTRSAANGEAAVSATPAVVYMA